MLLRTHFKTINFLAGRGNEVMVKKTGFETTARMAFSVSFFRVSFFRILCFLLILLSGCGRYITPTSPEELIPLPVDLLTASIVPEDGSLLITWMAPQSNISGKKLKELNGYQIEKAEGGADKTLSDAPLERQFEKVDFIPDTYYEELRKQRDATELRGDIVRKVKLKDPQKTFSYNEKTPPTGITIYRIYAVNDDGGDGDVKKAVQLTNQDDVKQVTVIDQEREKR